MAMDEALSWACVGLIYVGLAAAAVLLLQGKYLQMQRCLLLLTVGSNLRYPMLGLARGTTLLITVSNVFSYVSGVDPVDCNQITFDRLEGNEISMLAMFTCHPSWALDFWYGVVGGAQPLQLCMHLHIICNTTCLALSFLHIFGNFSGKARRGLGRASALSGMLGISCGLMVGLHGAQTGRYGGTIVGIGWIWMAGASAVCLGKGVSAVMRKNMKAHEEWMTRFYVLMWSNFLIFRLLLFVLTPVFEECRNCAFLIPTYASPAIGLVLAELLLRRKALGLVGSPATWAAGYRALK
ncbi:unnamed protein product [Effrenium voratum]|uniref:Uncharacterized protein n=1 Tax=Effrenium voratum TaxID=2562239 RepID=A0AA36JFP3_9DINO|nr:unnamed protein product [Effrenium voratum]